MDKRTLLLIFINLLLLGLLFYRIRKKKSFPNFLLMITFAIFFLSLIEFSYRLFFRDASYETGDGSKNFFKYDSSLGYVMNKTGKCPVTKITQWGDTIYNVTYTILPGSKSSNRPVNYRIGSNGDTLLKEIVFLGCSFTFGQGLNDSASLPWKSGKIANRNTVNLGTTGYGIHQVYQLYKEQYDSTPNDQRIFVYTFLPDHILRANGLYDWSLNGPSFKMEGDSLIHTGPIKRPDNNKREKYIHYVSMLGTFTFLHKMLHRIESNNQVRKLKENDYRKCFLMIRKMAQAIQQTGGKLIIINWNNENWGNRNIQDLPVEMIEKELNDLSGSHTQLVNVSSILDYNDKMNFIPKDGHPSVLANERIAQHITQLINK